MTLGLIGEKCGMTRIFTKEGESLPVSVIKIDMNRVVQMKNLENDGYNAVQITRGQKKPTRLNKALAGHYAKNNVAAGLGLHEFRLNENEAKDLKTGDALKLDIFKEGQLVDVQGVTRGKGFAGVIKRHHFKSQNQSHGNSLSHRAPGSIGQRQTPGRVFPGKKMAGHLGDVNRTVPNQKIVKIDTARNLLLVQGGIPGAPGGIVIVKPASKAKKTKEQ